MTDFGAGADIMDPEQHYIHSENRGAVAIYDSSDLTITLTLATSGGDGAIVFN